MITDGSRAKKPPADHSFVAISVANYGDRDSASNLTYSVFVIEYRRTRARHAYGKSGARAIDLDIDFVHRIGEESTLQY